MCCVRPWALVTVLPGQLPVCWFIPVSSLKTVLLPTLGLPASATTFSSGLSFSMTRPLSAALRPVESDVSPIYFSFFIYVVAAVVALFGVSAGSFSAANTRTRSASRRLSATTVPRTKKAVGSPEGLLYKQRISVPSINPISRSLRRMLPLDKSLCTVAVIPCRTWDRAISFVVIFSILLFIRRVRNDIVPYPYTMPTPLRPCDTNA